jgi:hypothetical protein
MVEPDSPKYQMLIEANERLNIGKTNNTTIVFVYTPPKVGSTSVVSSLRLFCSDKFDIIHIHDEEMLKVLGSVENVTVNELIHFNKQLGKNVYVIDVYRSPIERKISAFFEKIGSYHFNDIDSNVNKYNVQKVITRFNNIFPWIANGDHFMEKYDIELPPTFDYTNKYLCVSSNGITYLKLRLKDSYMWGSIMSNIFGTKMIVVKDYESTNKPIRDLYRRFKAEYKVPSNFLEDLTRDPHFQYYYSAEERDEYIHMWSQTSAPSWSPYTNTEYKLYENITLENCHMDVIQPNHYIDEGCLCKSCFAKRRNLGALLLSGLPYNGTTILHEKAAVEMLQKKVDKVKHINNLLQQVGPRPGLKAHRGKNFGAEMNSIVKNQGR